MDQGHLTTNNPPWKKQWLSITILKTLVLWHPPFLMSPIHLNKMECQFLCKGMLTIFYFLFLLYTLHILENALHDNVMLKKEWNVCCEKFFSLMMMHTLKLDQSSLTSSKVSNPLWTFLSTTNEINFHMDSQIMHLNEHIKWHKILSHLLPKKVDYFFLVFIARHGIISFPIGQQIWYTFISRSISQK